MSGIDKKGEISKFTNDHLKDCGLHVIGFGGVDHSMFDDSDILIDQNGSVIYHPGVKSEFGKIEESLGALIDKGKLNFTVSTHPYMFFVKDGKTFILANRPFNEVEETMAYANLGDTFGRPSMMPHRFVGICFEGAMWMFRAGYSELAIVQAKKAEKHAKVGHMECDKDGKKATDRAIAMIYGMKDCLGVETMQMLLGVLGAITNCREDSIR